MTTEEKLDIVIKALYEVYGALGALDSIARVVLDENDGRCQQLAECTCDMREILEPLLGI